MHWEQHSSSAADGVRSLQRHGKHLKVPTTADTQRLSAGSSFPRSRRHGRGHHERAWTALPLPNPGRRFNHQTLGLLNLRRRRKRTKGGSSSSSSSRSSNRFLDISTGRRTSSAAVHRGAAPLGSRQPATAARTPCRWFPATSLSRTEASSSWGFTHSLCPRFVVPTSTRPSRMQVHEIVPPSTFRISSYAFYSP